MTARAARRADRLGSGVAALVLGAPMAWLWGFSVDDAFITARVAAHIQSGIGYRFNSGGPIVDTVTPLGFAYLLAPASHGDPLRAFYFAKWLGAWSGLLAAAFLGRAVAQMGGSAFRWTVLLPVLVSAPLAAWCVSGMETGVIVLLVTLSLSARRIAGLAGGMAAALRPELVPWTVALALGRNIARRDPPGRIAGDTAIALGPAVSVAVLRYALFGHVAPLAIWAKPSDLRHGLFYVTAALIWTGVPLLIVAPFAVRRLDGESRAILVAVGAHCLALVLAGGDWMALFRLFVPVVPALLLVGARIAAFADVRATAARVVAATGISAVLFFAKSQASRAVLEQRLSLISGARSALAGVREVAALDVGWVGVATDADIVDLAGVTDEAIAHLPGGHTSKRVPPHLLSRRRVGALVLLTTSPAQSPLESVVWSRVVEARVAREAVELGATVTASLELSGTSERYLVLRLQNPP